MFKKILAVAMATAMVFSVAQVAPVNTETANAAEPTPVVAYTFDGDKAEGLTLKGEANIKDGVLNLATKETHGETYAQLPDLTKYDFSNGVTLTANIMVKDVVLKDDGALSDWTSIFMLGDGTIGGNGEDATALYHLSLGFSSVGGIKGDYFQGYFGNVISAPYTWDWYKTDTNRNKWNTLTVTIAKDKMTTYIDGQAVQVSAEGSDFTNVLQAFKVAKNNYLGVSYWPVGDPDFIGSMDNVAIYNSVLTSEQIANMSLKSDVKVDPPKPVEQAQDNNKKKTLTLMEFAATTAKVTGELNTAPGKVTVKAGTKTFAGTVKGKAFTVKLTGVKAGTKLTLVIEKDGYITLNKNLTAKGTMKLSKVKAKKNAKKITGTVSEKKATVKIKIGKKKYKKAKVSGKKFTLKCAKLKKGTKVKIQVTKKNYKTLTKTYKVK